MSPDPSGGLLFSDWSVLFLFVIRGLGYKKPRPVDIQFSCCTCTLSYLSVLHVNLGWVRYGGKEALQQNSGGSLTNRGQKGR